MRWQGANPILHTAQAGIALKDLGNTGHRPGLVIDAVLHDGLLPLESILLLDAKHDNQVNT
jgi:hypothetical protein